MKLGLALGAAVIATTMIAYAADDHRRFVFHRGDNVSADSNGDGWLSRDEAAAQADRLFADLDRNNDGRVTDVDHQLLAREVEAEVERAMAGIEIDLEGLDEEIEASMQFMNDEDCTTTTDTENGQRRVTTVCRSHERDDDDEDDRADRRVNRHVRVMRHGGDMLVGPIPPVPPTPPTPPIHAPMFGFGGDDDEADLNGDGALSREEFRAQQLRFFDARDANGDGRVRYESPPEAPTPPTPPRRR